ncbi:hypothetical protein RFF05_12295 [Bengtsoniella intestinalis]|uniref:hypothetical protein n=1 Tax=Bengtsoniella intestinalis TaxID=3073143 RepID=UPI00391F90C4
MTVFDQYFTFWDAALIDESALEALIDLFADGAVVKSAQGEVSDVTVLKMGIKATLQNYVSMKHVWHTTQTDTGFRATWAVVHELKTGEMHAAVGMDLIELDGSGKIKFLEIIPEQNITKKI